VKLSDRIQTVHKHIFVLVCLSIGTVPLFLFTRDMASRNREMHQRRADMWYRQGQQELQSGKTEDAIDSFRKATTNDHDNLDYRLALGRSLARLGSVDEARRSLLQFRETAPENGEVNLELARLVARSGDVDEATRYYHSALYGLWPPDEINRRRREVRIELITFLFANDENTKALSELLVLGPDMEDTPSDRTRAGQWFLRAGDAERARAEFGRALELDKNDVEALDGMGTAEFQMMNFSRATMFLQAAETRGEPSASRERLMAVSKAVLADDPLAERISNSQKLLRLRRIIESRRERLETCLPESSRSSPVPGTSPIEMEAEAFIRSLTARNLENDPELVRKGLDLAVRMDRVMTQSCSPSGDSSEVLTRIRRLHGIENE